MISNIVTTKSICKMNLENYNSMSVIDTLNKHVSIRDYTSEPISEDLLSSILLSARRSPTSSNMQAYSFVVVRDQEVKKKLAEFAGNQKHVETCPVFIAICADISRLEVACEMHDKTLGKNLENTLVATIDAALAGMSVCSAAESYGLGTVMIGGMRNHPKKVSELLNFPSGVLVVYGLCIGWPEKISQQKPRLEAGVNIHYEKYDDSGIKAKITGYDGELAKFYSSERRQTPDEAWSGVVARGFSTPRRPHLRGELEELGFRFD
ncbi:MAG: NADPH-dependent oxidoreductase [Candidatus Heimdallarchaeota archaeon]|nr:NADPH-dependent oxidoreductase [Candidatus Heimdallarchaeota archaeon]